MCFHILKSDVEINPWTIHNSKIKILFHFISCRLSGSNLLSISLLLFLRPSLSLALVLAKVSGTSLPVSTRVQESPPSQPWDYQCLHRLWILTQNLKELLDETISWPPVLMNEVELAIFSFCRLIGPYI